MCWEPGEVSRENWHEVKQEKVKEALKWEQRNWKANHQTPVWMGENCCSQNKVRYDGCQVKELGGMMEKGGHLEKAMDQQKHVVLEMEQEKE